MSTKKIQFIATDWVLARKAWAKNHPDEKTGERGTTLYWPEDGSRSNLPSNYGDSALISFKPGDQSPDPDKTVTYLAHYGGQAKYQTLPENAYINLNPEYDGPSRFMKIEMYSELCADHKISVPTVVSLAQQVYQA